MDTPFSQLMRAQADYTQDPEEWPPNVKSARKKPSPASAYLGLELIGVSRAAGMAEMVFHATDQLCNKWGGVQGGMVAAMLDDAMAFAVGLGLDWGQISPTLEIKVSMLAPVRPGPVYALGKVLRRGRSVGFIEGELRDGEGNLLATGSTTTNFVTLKKS